jgi:carbohydrate-binding DOMON domain-containing protein
MRQRSLLLHAPNRSCRALELTVTVTVTVTVTATATVTVTVTVTHVRQHAAFIACRRLRIRTPLRQCPQLYKDWCKREV